MRIIKLTFIKGHGFIVGQTALTRLSTGLFKQNGRGDGNDASRSDSTDLGQFGGEHARRILEHKSTDARRLGAYTFFFVFYSIKLQSKWSNGKYKSERLKAST